jgi:hypothetical protein
LIRRYWALRIGYSLGWHSSFWLLALSPQVSHTYLPVAGTALLTSILGLQMSDELSDTKWHVPHSYCFMMNSSGQVLRGLREYPSVCRGTVRTLACFKPNFVAMKVRTKSAGIKAWCKKMVSLNFP